ncbi:hypothetical protein TNCV_2171931 [Trichonephila clavipes]|nr:hypothetical protein TNCV_2171931 [Trichonephila clavipes]
MCYLEDIPEELRDDSLYGGMKSLSFYRVLIQLLYHCRTNPERCWLDCRNPRVSERTLETSLLNSKNFDSFQPSYGPF